MVALYCVTEYYLVQEKRNRLIDKKVFTISPGGFVNPVKTKLHFV